MMLSAEVPPFLLRSFVGQGLWTRMYNSFGYLTKAGYGGHVFPVVFGETGSFLTAVSCLLSNINLVHDSYSAAKQRALVLHAHGSH